MGNSAAGHEGYPPPDCSGQEEGQSFLASSWASRAVAAAPSFQTCFACIHMYILYACVYICVCVEKSFPTKVARAYDCVIYLELIPLHIGETYLRLQCQCDCSVVNFRVESR